MRVIPDTTTFPLTSYLVLGTLQQHGEHSGYDIHRILQRDMAHVVTPPAKSQIYGELRRLEECGYITVRDIAQVLRPDKRLYTIKSAGREAMATWLQSRVVEEDHFRSADLALLVFTPLEQEALITRLAHRQRTLAVRYVFLKETKDRCVEEMETLVTRWLLDRSIRLVQEELQWVDGCLAACRQHFKDAATPAQRKKRVAR